MNDQGSKGLFADKRFYEPSNGHRTVEVYPGVGTKGASVEVSSVPERRLASYWRGPPVTSTADARSPRLKLLVCSPRVLDRNIWPLPFSSRTFMDLLDALGLLQLFPRTICHQIPIATVFDIPGRETSHGLILRTNLSWTWQYALGLVHDTVSNTTNAILLGLRNDEIEQFLQSVTSQASNLAECPAMLPCFLMDDALSALVLDAEERRKGLLQICQQTGHQGFLQRSSLTHGWDERDELDLDFLMQRLTSLSDACAGISAVCKMQHNFIAAVGDFHSSSSNTPTPSLARQQLRFFTQMLHGVESKISYTRDSVQGQVQTIYALIGQRDSRSHFVLAETSRKLAELSQRDSTDMRVIAAVTLVFLPATFVSTFFSASFFNFQPAGGDHVSSWVWLYWAITAGLTAVVLLSWWYLTRQKQRKAEASLKKDEELKEQAFQRRVSTWQSEGSGKTESSRPYLGGSVSEGLFARKGRLAYMLLIQVD